MLGIPKSVPCTSRAVRHRKRDWVSLKTSESPCQQGSVAPGGTSSPAQTRSACAILARSESVNKASRGAVPRLVLIYFDFDGSRGETARVALHLAGIPFEDRRIAGKDWPALRDQMPFQQLPVLEVDGQSIAQSNTINRYVGRLAGLYPTDDLQAARVDEVMDAVEDISTKISHTMRLDEAAKKLAREALVAGPLPRYLQQIEARLNAGGGEWFAENRLTVADLKCYYWVRWLVSGALDHIPADLVDEHAPLLTRHAERVKTEPRIAAYYAARGK